MASSFSVIQGACRFFCLECIFEACLGKEDDVMRKLFEFLTTLLKLLLKYCIETKDFYLKIEIGAKIVVI